MKKLLFIAAFLLSAIGTYAQGEVNPSFNVNVEKIVAHFDIEGKGYDNVAASFTSKNTEKKNTVTIIVVNDKRKKVYKKTISNSFLYVYPNGQIEVGKPDFTQVVVGESNVSSNRWIGKIRIKTGV